jgi:hypothetical protein
MEAWNLGFVMGYQHGSWTGERPFTKRRLRELQALRALTMFLDRHPQLPRRVLFEGIADGVDEGDLCGGLDMARRGGKPGCPMCAKSRDPVSRLLRTRCEFCIRMAFAAAERHTIRGQRGSTYHRCCKCDEESGFVAGGMRLCPECFERWWAALPASAAFW